MTCTAAPSAPSGLTPIIPMNSMDMAPSISVPGAILRPAGRGLNAGGGERQQHLPADGARLEGRGQDLLNVPAYLRVAQALDGPAIAQARQEVGRPIALV